KDIHSDTVVQKMFYKYDNNNHLTEIATDRYSFLYTNNETGHPLTEFIVINNYPDDTAKTYYEYIRYPNGTIQYVREYNSKEKLNQNNFYKESKLTEGELFDYVLFKMENMDIKTVYEG